MTAKNRQKKEELKALYTCKCFLTNLNESRRNGLTYHHIEKGAEGGKTTIENGAILLREIHQWLHTQEHKNYQLYELVNECLQLYKKCIEERKFELIRQYQEECSPLFVKEMRKRR